MKLFKLIMSVLLLSFSLLSYADTAPVKEVALTIDDLPFVGSANGNEGKLRREHKRFELIFSMLQKMQIPVIGFVIAGAIEQGQWELLQQFHQAGYALGNHTYSHKGLGYLSAEAYIADVEKADTKLTPLLTTPKYFRYPYLSEGAGTAKFSTVRNYLASKNYTVAPVTIDSKDFEFNARFLDIPWRERKKYLNSYRQRYLGFIWAQTLRAEKKADKALHRPIKHILLLHMNTLNSYFLEDVIKLFQSHGYRFISLTEALQDPYYKSTE